MQLINIIIYIYTYIYILVYKTRKDGARPALFLVVVLLYVLFVLFYVFLCSLYCLFCDVPCIVCVYMCTEQLPPGGYPIAVCREVFLSRLYNCILLTAWSRVIFEKLTGSQLVKKFLALCGSQRFVTLFTRARHLSLILSQISLIHGPPSRI